MAAAVALSARKRIGRAALDLTGHVVITEAATGAYAVTAAAATAAGGKVFALAADTPYGSAGDAVDDVSIVATNLGVSADDIHFTTDRGALPLGRATLVTNSGVLRPLDETLISHVPDSAVIALMFEAWEARTTDLDYAAAYSRGIEIIGVDEHHPACDAFIFVGDLALYGIRQQQWPIRGTKIVVFSDNLFADPVAQALKACGAEVTATSVPADSSIRGDIAVVAMTPNVVASGEVDAARLSKAVAAIEPYGCVQLWGDLERSALEASGIAMAPATEPPIGHQGFPMTAAGIEAVVRLQIGGLAAVHHRSAAPGSRFFGLAQPLRPEDGASHDS